MFPIILINILDLYSNDSDIPESPAYGVFVSQLIRYARIGLKFEYFLFRASILVSKLLKQGYSSKKLQTIFRKLYGRYTDLVHKFLLSCQDLADLKINKNIPEEA